MVYAFWGIFTQWLTWTKPVYELILKVELNKEIDYKMFISSLILRENHHRGTGSRCDIAH